MVPTGRSRLGYCVALLVAASPIHSAAAQPAPPPATSAADARLIDQRNMFAISQAVGKDDDRPETRKLADRQDVSDAFDRYRQAGGLASKSRFAQNFAATAGFSTFPGAQDVDDGRSKKELAALRAHPAAFDLVCKPKAAGDKPSRRSDAAEAPQDAPSAPLRFSVDVAAGLWRPENGFVQPLHVGKDGKLVTRWQVDLGHPVWGDLRYGRAARDYVEIITTTDPATKQLSRATVRATCKLAPYSKLFGAPRG